MIRGQLRIGARQAKNAPLDMHFVMAWPHIKTNKVSKSLALSQSSDRIWNQFNDQSTETYVGQGDSVQRGMTRKFLNKVNPELFRVLIKGSLANRPGLL